MSGIVIESGAQLLVRISSEFRPSLNKLESELFPDDGPHQKKLIEITGEPNSGKSILLMEIMARALLPSHFGGKGSDVVFLDLDNKFSILLFTRILEKIVNMSGEATDAAEIKETVENSLKHIHIYNCYSSEEFQLSLIALDRLLFTNKDISLVAVDSICAFYWLDCQIKAIKMENHYKKVVGKIKDICTEYSIVVVYSRPTYYACKWNANILADYLFELVPCSEGLKGIELKISINGKNYNKFFTVDIFGFKMLG